MRDFQVPGPRLALIRVDFNVPQDKATGAITNNQRIVAALPTIKHVLDHGAGPVARQSFLIVPATRERPRTRYHLRAART